MTAGNILLKNTERGNSWYNNVMQAVTDLTFMTEVEEASAKQVVVVDFSASWCQPCQKMKPLLEQFAVDTPQAKVVVVDVDEAPQAVERFGIMSVPTYMVFAGGTKKRIMTGAAPHVIDTLRGCVDEFSVELSEA